MSAYNELLADVTCPACERAVTLVCQTHAASSFDGDATGRFCHHRYRVGERMRWWPESDPRFRDWLPRGSLDDDAVEGCYASCPACGAEVAAEVHFLDVTPVSVAAVFEEGDWPSHLAR